jgi:hypothetical protein
VASVLPEVEKLGQAVEAATALQEVVAHQLTGTRARLDVDAETDGQEGLELLGQLVGLLEAGGTVGGDEVQRLQRLLVEVRRLGLDHLNGHDTEGPDVNLVTVLLLLDDLGRHPVGGSDHGRALGALFGELGTETEIGWAWLDV